MEHFLKQIYELPLSYQAPSEVNSKYNDPSVILKTI